MTYLVKRHDIVVIADNAAVPIDSRSNAKRSTGGGVVVGDDRADTRRTSSNSITDGGEQNYDEELYGEIIFDTDHAHDEADAVDESRARTRRVVEFEWHVVFSPTFQVPTLYFNISDLGMYAARC